MVYEGGVAQEAFGVDAQPVATAEEGEGKQAHPIVLGVYLKM